MPQHPRTTLIDFFEDLSAERGEFLVYDDGYRLWRRSYQDVIWAARAFAQRLRAENIGKGDKVVFWAENRPEWVAALWGCLLQGVVAVPVDYHSSHEFASRIAGIVEARAILVGDRVRADALRAGCPRWTLADFEWPAREPLRAPEPALTGADLAQIVFTSGATAEPKGVLITHSNLLSNIVPVEIEVKKYRKWGTPFYPIRFLNLLPLSHLFGQSLGTFIPPMIGGTVVFQRSYHPAEITRQIRSMRVSVLVSVPKILEVLRDHIQTTYQEASEPAPQGHWIRKWWRYRRIHRAFGWKFWAFIVGAAPLDPAIEEFWSRMGFLVIQGYGLTETAPIVTLNHPFHARKGTVGTPIGGVEVKLAEDGEVLVRGGNVSQGYYGGSDAGSFTNGWLHTGDIGEKDAEGRLVIRGRKKDLIVLSDGRKVFPDDVEAVLRSVRGVHDCAVIGPDRVHAVLSVEPGADAEEIVRRANTLLEEQQKIREVSIWPAGEELPRTPGTAKLKRGEIRERLNTGRTAQETAPNGGVIGLLHRYAPNRAITPDTTLDQLGLSSLDRVQLLVELERELDTPVDESAFASAKTVADLTRPRQPSNEPAPEPFQFPAWNRSWPARWVRRILQAVLLRPLTRYYARNTVTGIENLRELQPPVIFAPNHQSFMDVPAILCALPPRWRDRIAPAMAKEFFEPHFHPSRFSRYRRFVSGIQYYLSTLFFNAFPLPQREAGARRTLRYMGELTSQGWCVLIFPEGDRTRAGELHTFQPGAAMLASQTRVPVVPVRIEGLHHVLHRDAHWPTRGPVTVAFGRAIRLDGTDYPRLTEDLRKAIIQAGESSTR